MKRILALLVFVTGSACAQTNDWDAGQNPTPVLESAQFRWWIPEGVEKIHGVLVVLPGNHGDSRNAIDDPEWRAIALKHSLAVMGARLLQKGSNPSFQEDPDGKTSDTIVRAVSELAAASGHREATQGPLAFWGHSAGANCAERFALRNPRRTICVVDIKGTWGPGEAARQKCEIPFLCTIGKKDRPEWVETSCGNYERGKLDGALWTLAFHQKEGHEGGGTKPLAVAYLDEVIALRIGDPAKWNSPSAPALKKLDSKGGWLGDPESLDAAPFSEYPGQKRTATWLPGPLTAAAWKLYLQSSK